MLASSCDTCLRSYHLRNLEFVLLSQQPLRLFQGKAKAGGVTIAFRCISLCFLSVFALLFNTLYYIIFSFSLIE